MYSIMLKRRNPAAAKVRVAEYTLRERALQELPEHRLAYPRAYAVQVTNARGDVIRELVRR